MEISKGKLQELTETAYLNGQRALLLGQLGNIISRLSINDDMTKERLILERVEALQALRSICANHGDNEWPDDLNLSDIINKHLVPYLNDKQ